MAVVHNTYTLIPTQEFLDELTEIFSERKVVPDLTLVIDGTEETFAGYDYGGWDKSTSGWGLEVHLNETTNVVDALLLDKASASAMSSITVSGFKKGASTVAPIWSKAKGGVTLYTNAATGSTVSAEPSPLFRENNFSAITYIESIEELAELSKSAVTIAYESGGTVKRYYPCSFVVTGEQALFSVIDINVLNGQQTVRYFGAGTGK